MEAPPAQPQTEQSPLNVEKVEKQTLGMDMMRQDSQVRTQVEEFKEKVKKPAITTSLIIYSILNVIMLCVGGATVHDCPIKPIIPIYLIVAGVLGVVTKILPLINMKLLNSKIIERVLYALYLIEFIWMILGSVWIYSIYEPPYTPITDQPHCNKTAYLLAFWLLTLNYIFLLLVILIPCFAVCCICFCTMCLAANTQD